MEGLKYKCFCLVFKNKKLVWKGNVEVRAYDAVGAISLAKKQLKDKHPDSVVTVPGKSNPRLV